jgi:hypothetical protein
MVGLRLNAHARDITLYVFREGDVGNNWGKWAVFGVAAAFNVLAFATVAILRRKRA